MQPAYGPPAAVGKGGFAGGRGEGQNGRMGFAGGMGTAWAAGPAPPPVADFGAPGWLWWAALASACVLAGLLLRVIVKARLNAEARRARRRARPPEGGA
jgi:hypothetical protein